MNPRRLTEDFVTRRMKLFRKLLKPISKPLTLLDVGGTVGFWREHMMAGVQITVLNVFEQASTNQINVLVGDGCDLSAFGRYSYDVVFSNSALAFVGSWQRQRALAREIRRVGQRYFVQTPNQNFFVDWRTLVPFFHWLEPTRQAWFLERMRVGRYRKMSKAEAYGLATRVRDLTQSEMHTLFPEATIVAERLIGMTKSFVAYYGMNPCSLWLPPQQPQKLEPQKEPESTESKSN
jgi:Methyltransferase domain